MARPRGPNPEAYMEFEWSSDDLAFRRELREFLEEELPEN